MSQVLDYEPLPSLGREHRPLLELLMLAGPTIAQMASYTVMQFTDRWMLSYVGDIEAATAGTSGLTFFCVLGFGMGVLFVVNTLVSQAFGRRDHAATGQFMWQGVWFGLIFGMLTASMYPFAGDLFRFMGHEPKVVALEASFFRVVALAGWLKLVAMALNQFLLGVHRPTIVLVGAILGIIANLFFNWLLIYGNWGFPKMGIVGSAWGTNAAVLVELIICGAYVLRPKIVATFNTLDWHIRWDMLRTVLKIGIPAGFQLICDIVAWTVFLTMIVGSFSTAALTANSFAFTYMHVCFMPALGVGSAVTALVGKYIGMGRHDLAERRAHFGFFVCAIYMVLAGLVLFCFRVPLLNVFSNDPEVIRIGSTVMGFVAIYQIFDAMFVIYVSALRGAGDTLVPAAVQAVLVWSIVVGGGFVLLRYAPEWGVIGPWTAATIFGGLLGVFLLMRFLRGGWKQIKLHGEPGSNVEPASATVSATL